MFLKLSTHSFIHLKIYLIYYGSGFIVKRVSELGSVGQWTLQREGQVNVLAHEREQMHEAGFPLFDLD